MAQKITRYLFIALILTLGFGQLLRIEIGNLPFFVHDSLVVAILLVNYKKVFEVVYRQCFKQLLITARYNYGKWYWQKKDFFTNEYPYILIGLLVGWFYLLNHVNFALLLTPLLYSLRLTSYLLLYLLASASKIKIPKSYFYLAGFITLAIGVGQYLLMPDMRWAQYLGWDDHLNRIILPHYDPTFTAAMLSLVLIMLIKSKKWLLSLVYIIPLLLTYSRSIWLSLLLAIFIEIKNKRLFFVGLIILAAAFFLVPKSPGEGTNLLRTFSISSRVEHDLSIVKNLGFELVIGRGYNYFAINNFSDKGYPNHAAGPNNSYLLILSTMGIAGAIGWLMFIKRLYLNSKQQVVITFILVASLFNNVFFYPFVMLWLFLTETVMAPNES